LVDNLSKIEEKIQSLKPMEYKSYKVSIKPRNNGIFEIKSFCNYNGQGIFESETVFPLEIPYYLDEDTTSFVSYLKILRLDTDTTAEEIKRRWKELSKYYHPDTTQNENEKMLKEKILKEINEAYDELKNYY
jgi:hypothetical protein